MTTPFSKLLYAGVLLSTIFGTRLVNAATHAGSAPYKTSSTGAGNSYAPVFSADGKHVAFVSHANNLVTNDDIAPHLDLFVRDLMASNTVLVSVSTNGFGGANDNIELYTLSSNAQVIVFETLANNLAPGDTNRWRDIYVRDLASGVTRLITPGADGPSSNPLISEDGQRVIFESLASNLVTNDFNGTNDIFIHDLTTGVTELVTLNSSSTASPDGPSHSPSISADGLTVAFVSHATNLVEGVTNTLWEVYARKVAERKTRWAVASHIPWATRQDDYYSVPWRWPIGGTSQPFVPYVASSPVLSADGRYVAFKTLKATVRFDLQLETNAIFMSFPTGDFNRTNRFEFQDNPRTGIDSCETPLAFTRDGRFLIVNNTNRNAIKPPGIGLVDFETLVTNSWRYYSANLLELGYETNVSHLLSLVLSNSTVWDANVRWTKMPFLHVNPDASQILFVADATNLVAGVTNRTFQLYSLTISNGVVALRSTNSTGELLGSLDTLPITASSDGSLTAFESPDDSLVPDDLNRAWDVFMRNVDTGETTLISARHPELPASTSTSLARIDTAGTALSPDGERLAVLSLDGVMVPDETNHLRDLFLIDLSTNDKLQAPRPLSPDFPFGTLAGDATAPVISTNGRFVAYGFGSASSSGTNRAIVWLDTESPTNPVLVASLRVGNSGPAMSADGRLVAFHSADYLDRRYADGNGASDVFVRLLPQQDSPPCDARDPMAISLAWSRMQTGIGASFNPVFSPDSRWLLFESLSATLLAQPLSQQSSGQLYARSLRSGSDVEFDCSALLAAISNSPALLLSYDTAASLNPAGLSTETPLPGGGSSPRFSADSKFVFFGSASGAVYRHDMSVDYIEKVTSIGGVTYTNFARATNDLVCTNCSAPFPSGNGRYAAYESSLGSSSITNVYWKDLANGNVELISAAHSGAAANGSSFSPLMTRDARFVIFASRASNLLPGDNNRAMDIFVRDRWAGTTLCLSGNRNGTGNGVSSNPVLSANGRTVAFHSFASDLVAGDFNNTRDVFLVTIGGPDADGDGMDDDWEMAYFNTLVRDGSGDFDGDGANDRFEFVAGTNPTNNRSILSVVRFTMEPAGGANGTRTIVLTWSAIPGKRYQVESKGDLNASWLPFGSEVVATTTSASASYELDSDALNARPNAFYRVTVVH